MTLLTSRSLIIVLVGLLLMGITSASIYIPSILELMRILNVSNTDEGVTNDVASAIFFLSLNCGEIIGPTLGGYLTKKFDFEFSCIFTSLIAFLYFLMMSWINLDSIRLLYHKLYDFKNYNNCLVAKENESTKKCLINEDEYFPR